MNSKKHIHKFTIIVCAIFLLALLGYWVYKFGIFTPERGTSIASSSVLWGQFIVSFLAVMVLNIVLIIIDTRQTLTSIIKLASFWILILVLLSGGYYYYHKQVAYGFTHTYKVGEEFNYLTYKFKINKIEIKDVPLEDCSKDVVQKGRINWCEYSNEANKDKKQAFINLSVTNTYDTFKHFTPDWFKSISGNGKNYPLHSVSENYIPNEIQPSSAVTGDLKTGYLDKGETAVYSIEIKIDNHAEQIIKIAN